MTPFSLINSDLTTRVKTSDIVNDLTSTATNKPLSANQGKNLNDTKVSTSTYNTKMTSIDSNITSLNGRFVYNTLLEAHHSLTLTIKTNRIYLVLGHSTERKIFAGILSTTYGIHYNNIVDSTINMNWTYPSANQILFSNQDDQHVCLSVTEM